MKADTGQPLTVLQLHKYVLRSVVKLQNSTVLSDTEKHLMLLPGSSLSFDRNSDDEIKGTGDSELALLW